jgi:hypothetical protein
LLKITKLSKDTNLKAAFCTHNIIENILKPTSQTDECKQSGIYQMQCLDCPMKHTRQTGRAFNIRHKEHPLAIPNNNGNLGYSNHLLNTGHACGTIIDTVDVIKTGQKGKHLNTPEKCYTYLISKSNLLTMSPAFKREYYVLYYTSL